ncbi:MAG: hypothetical protein NDI77_09965, partial [Geobacteraceae bacterium]|nr:hypothetical protein [Geobacteraceae bacterium]
MIINGAFADDLEKGLQSELRDSRTSIVQAAAKLRSGASPAQEISRLKSIAEEIRASHLLMQERFRQQGEKASALGTLAVERQNAAAAEYGKALDEFLSLIDALPPEGTISQATLDALTTLLGKIIPRKSRPILGTLPYKHLGYPAREPATAPVVVPAYRGGNRIVAFADTASSAEAPISDEIVALAQSLQWKPVLIYEWVKNNVETEWYWGVMKGAEETLRQKSGNDADQAALLLALLRASGFPSRFVKGTIEFFPDIEKVKNLTGIDDPMRIAAFFQKAGIPFKPVIAGGKIANFQVEHIWVESEIPYSNYRGVVIDDFGKTWLALDTSIKPHGFTRNEPLDLPNSSFDTLRDEYLQNVHTVTPLEFLRSRAEEYLTQNIPGKTYQDLLSTKAIIPDVLKILPASLQFRQIAITGEFTELPAELRHQVRFTATGPANDNLLTVTLDAMRLSNQRVVLSYEPETVEDQQIIDSYGGFDNTPSYLVRLRPVLKLNGERLVVAQDGLPMGTDYTLAVEVITPNGTERISNRHIVGNLAVIGIVGQKALKPADIPVEEKNAERLLWEESLNYIDRWNQAEDELAALLKVAMARPLLTVVTVGGLIDVTYLLDIPHGFEWKGVFMDAALRRIETVTRTGDTARERSFMRLSALQGSILENRVFEDDFQVESVSTAKLLQLAATKGTQLFTIDKSNVDALLPTLPFDDAVNQDIASAVNQNLVVTIPRTEMTYRDWTGIGYVKENPASGESGWMLSGMVAGGDTADLPDKWAQWYLTQVLGSPYAKTNNDPRSAQRIIKVLAVDKQHTIVGRTTPEPLAVLVVDPVGLPVKGAMVTFKVVAGGGTFDAAGTAPEITVATGASGVAKAPFFVGRKTGDNAIYMMDQNGPNLTQVGLNLVTASVTGNYGTIQLADHFQAFGWPDVADHIEKVLPLDDSTTALANNPAGSIVAKVEDKYDNPVSNVSLTFTAMSAASKEPTSPLPAAARNIELYLPESCSVPYPLYGDCPTVTTLKVTTEYFGAVVNTILGNTVNTVYTVRVSAANVPSVKFTLSSEGYRNKTNDYIAPGLYIRSLQPVNERGQSINAAKAGSKLAVPLVSELFMLYDDVAPGGSGVTWSGIVKFKPIKDGTVNYEVAAGAGSVVNYANLGNGRYQAEYVTGAAPAVN